MTTETPTPAAAWAAASPADREDIYTILIRTAGCIDPCAAIAARGDMPALATRIAAQRAAIAAALRVLGAPEAAVALVTGGAA